MTLPDEDWDPFFGEGDPGDDDAPEPPRRTITYGAASWVRARAAGPPEDLSPVTIEHRRDHPFKKRPEKKRGCETCGGAKGLVLHDGHPGTMNVFGSGANRMAWQGKKKAWQERIVQLLDEAGLPKGLGGVYVDGTLGFPTRAKRDQGNYRYTLEKALGDALQEGGWLEDDDWTRYEFGRLRSEYEKGEAWMRLTFVPRWETDAAEEEPLAAQGTLLG